MEPLELALDADPDIGRRERPLILLHGVTLTRAWWDPIRDALRRIGPTVAVDLVGHGASPSPDDPAAYDFPAYVSHLEGVLARTGLESAWWVGHSMGGYIALRFAMERPDAVRGLLLTSTGPGMDDPEKRALRAQRDRDLADGTERHGGGWLYDHFNAAIVRGRAYEAESNRVVRARMEAAPAIGQAQSLRVLGPGTREPVWGRLAQVAVPTVLVCGTEDGAYAANAERFTAALPHGRLEWAEGAGHAINRDAPEAVVAAVERYFADPP